MASPTRRIVLMQLTAERESRNFWIRLKKFDGLDAEAPREEAVAVSVDDALEVVRKWLDALAPERDLSTEA
jgi:hypothetical protein